MDFHQHLLTGSSDCSGSCSGVFVTFNFESVLNLLPKHKYRRYRNLRCEIYRTAARREHNLVDLWWSDFLQPLSLHCTPESFDLILFVMILWRPWVFKFFVGTFLDAFAKLRDYSLLSVPPSVYVSVCLSVCPHATGLIFLKFYILAFFEIK
jgi:hypothetical protein